MSLLQALFLSPLLHLGSHPMGTWDGATHVQVSCLETPSQTHQEESFVSLLGAFQSNEGDKIKCHTL
jgi:hypothetical protein